MSQPLTLLEDMYVLPVGVEGPLELRRIIGQAEEQGFERICCCLESGASAAKSAKWAKDIREASAWTSIEIYSGQEARLSDEEGRLDLPPGPNRNDFILLSTRRYPLGETTYSVDELAALVTQGPFSQEHILQVSILALARALRRYRNVILADLHSPIRGWLDPSDRDSDPQAEELLSLLISAAEESGAGLLINEKQRSPSLYVARRFHQRQVPIFLGTAGPWSDSGTPYAYAKTVLDGLLSE